VAKGVAEQFSGAVAAVFVSDVRFRFVPSGELAEALFDLTRSERRVFKRLAAGDSLKGAAAALGVAVSTVKTHMLHLHQKMGISHRAELVPIAAAMALPVAS